MKNKEIKAGGEEDVTIYTPSEAVHYLREARGIDMSVAALRVRRNRNKAKAARVLGRTSLWTREELNKLAPVRKKPQPKVKEDIQA